MASGSTMLGITLAMILVLFIVMVAAQWYGNYGGRAAGGCHCGPVCGCGPECPLCDCGRRGCRDGMQSQAAPDKRSALRLAMQRLWLDHVYRTRLYIVSVLGKLPDQKQIEAYLLSNQDDIGRAVGAYYGAAAGAKLTALLREHIAIGGQIIAAVGAGRTQDVPALNTEWVANADEIASFLAGANPAWPEPEMRKMMRAHLTLTTNEVLARAAGHYDADITAFNAVVAEILEMSSMLAEGIIAQKGL